MFRLTLSAIGILAVIATSAAAQSVSPNGVKTLSPAGAIKPTGTWDLATRAGDFIYIAGMRGIDPKTDTLVQGDEARIRQAFLNMKLTALAPQFLLDLVGNWPESKHVGDVHDDAHAIAQRRALRFGGTRLGSVASH